MASRSLGTLTLDLIAKIGGFIDPMDRAARNAKKNSDAISKNLKSIAIAAGALGTAAAAGFAVMVKGSIDAADELYKQSQIIGMSVEQLSALKFTAGEAGVGFDLLTGSLSKFNKNIDEATRGKGAAFDAFADLGINLKDTNGELKTTSVLFEDVAGALSMLEDGATKTALAQDLLGKSGKDLIPLLNAGAEGLREGAEEAQRLGQVMGTEGAAAAERFNDNLSRLQKSITGIANVAAMDAAPALAEMTDVLADPEVQHGLETLTKGLITLGVEAVRAFAETAKFYGLLADEINRFVNGIDTSKIDDVQKRIASIRYVLENPFLAPAASPFLTGRFLGLSKDDLKSELDLLVGARERIQKEAALVRGSVADAARLAELEESGYEAVFDNVEELTAAQIEARRVAREANAERIEAAAEAGEAYEKMRADLQKEIDLIGNKSKAIELAYDLERGLITGLDSVRQKELVHLQKQIDLKQFYLELGKNEKSLSSELDQIIDGDIEAYKKLTKETASLSDDSFERISEAGSSMWVNFSEDAESALDGVSGLFTRTLAEMAHEGLTKPIIMNFQEKFMGESGSGSGNADQAGQAAGAISKGGWVAAIAVAVMAGAKVWNKDQEEKFEQMTAEYRQGTQAIGSILGITNQKSQSVGEAIEELNKFADQSLGVNRDMLNALIDIRSGIAGVASGFARQFGLSGVGDSLSMESSGTLGINNGIKRIGDFAVSADFLNYQKATGMLLPGVAETLSDSRVVEFVQGFMGGITDKISKNLYSKKTKVIDSGIGFIGQTLADILAEGSIEAFAYADVQTKKKLFGINTSTKVKTQQEDLDEIYAGQFADIFTSGAEVLKKSSAIFGIQFEDYLDSLVIDPQKLSLKGLEGDALAGEIEAFISKNLDAFSSVLLVGTDVLDKYQLVGEGAFDTMIRLAGQTQAFVDAANLLDLKFSDVDMAAVDSVQALADAAGGFDSLSSSLGNYANKFLDDSDRFTNAQKQVAESYAALGLEIPKTRDEFKSLIEDGVGDPELFTSLLGLVDATDYYLGALDKQLQLTTANALALTDFMEPFEEAIAKSGMSDFEAAIYDVNRALADSIGRAQELGASEQQLALIRGDSENKLAALSAQREAELSDFIGGFTDAIARSGMSDFEAAIYDVNQALADSIGRAQELGASEQQLALIRGDSENKLAALSAQREAELSGFIGGFADAIARSGMSNFEAAIYDVNKALADSIGRAQELGASEQQLALIRGDSENKLAALSAQREAELSDFIGGFTDAIARSGMSDFEAAIYDVNKALVESIARAQELGATEAQLASVRQASALEIQKIRRDETDLALADLRGAIDAEKSRREAVLQNDLDSLASVRDASLEAANVTLQGKIDSANAWMEKQVDFYEKQIDSLSDSVNGLRDLSSGLRSTVEELLMVDQGAAVRRREQALLELDDAILLARGGNTPGREQVDSIIGNIGVSESNFSTVEDYVYEAARTAAKVSELADLADAQATAEELMIGQLKASQVAAGENTDRLIERYGQDTQEQIAAIAGASQKQMDLVQKIGDDEMSEMEKQYAAFEQEINALRGIDKSVLTVSDAITRLADVIRVESELYPRAAIELQASDMIKTNTEMLNQMKALREETYKFNAESRRTASDTVTVLREIQIQGEEAA